MSEEEGIKAIIFLQKLVDKDEPIERARKNWRGFKDWEKKRTIEVYHFLSEEV